MGKEINIVMKYESRGDLHKLVMKKKSKLTWEQKLEMAKDIAEGLSYLHDKNIIHGDIKPSNVLVSSKYRCKLSDFGISSIMKNGRKPKNAGLGTEIFLAPELFNGNISYPTKECDVYSLGMTLYELFEGKEPYQETFEWFRAMSSNERPRISSKCPHSISTLLQRCWNEDEKERPSIHEVIQVLQRVEPQGVVEKRKKKKEMEPQIVGIDVY